MINELKRALDWLEHRVDRGSINYPMLATAIRYRNRFAREPRFQHQLTYPSRVGATPLNRVLRLP